MLEIKKKKYEIEEKIRLSDENDETLYEFDMKITPEELLEIKRILFEDAEKLSKKYNISNFEEKEKLETQVEEAIKSKTDRFEDICFKEHKQPFKDLAGQYKFEELVGEITGFFMKFFVEKQIKPLNTSIMNLKNFMRK